MHELIYEPRQPCMCSHMSPEHHRLAHARDFPRQVLFFEVQLLITSCFRFRQFVADPETPNPKRPLSQMNTPPRATDPASTALSECRAASKGFGVWGLGFQGLWLLNHHLGFMGLWLLNHHLGFMGLRSSFIAYGLCFMASHSKFKV
jgi:hypothetical protein